MAIYDNARLVAGGHLLGGRSANFFGNIFAAFADWNDARITRKALGRLSNRELDDIGLVRGDIDRITDADLIR